MRKLSIIIPVYNQEYLVIKALDNIPRRDDIEILVRDDGSTDHTLERLQEYKNAHPGLPLTIYANGVNRGVAWTKNRLLGAATGEYVHIHDSDDYCITEVYNRLIDECLNGADIVCFDLRINDGSHMRINEDSKRGYCAQIARFIRREFIGDLRFREHIRAGDDWFFAEDLLAKNPVSIYTNKIAYHYNFPREGSLFDMQRKGQLPPITAYEH